MARLSESEAATKRKVRNNGRSTGASYPGLVDNLAKWFRAHPGEEIGASGLFANHFPEASVPSIQYHLKKLYKKRVLKRSANGRGYVAASAAHRNGQAVSSGTEILEGERPATTGAKRGPKPGLKAAQASGSFLSRQNTILALKMENVNELLPGTFSDLEIDSLRSRK